jgi:hypothetical protein
MATATTIEQPPGTASRRWRVIILSALLVVSLAALAGGGYVRSIDPARPGTSHRVTLHLHSPCVRVSAVIVAERTWDSVDRPPVNWPADGPVEGTLRVIALDQAVFEADIGGTANYHRLREGLVFPDQSCPIY